MGISMEKILKKFDDCDKFSLTGNIENYNVTEEEFKNALIKIEKYNKEKFKKEYDNNKENLKNYPEFDKLYEDIKQECYEFNNEENRKIYLNKYFNDEIIKEYKQMGLRDEEIDKIKKNFFQCGFIADTIGKTTKYGQEFKNFFYHLYHDIAWNIDREKDKEKYCVNNSKSPLEQIPEELKEHFLYYEISFYNSVTISGSLMINYYFKLNDTTKKYLLQFKNDFCMVNLEDLTLYKGDEIKFYSCTHEGFNSIDFN